MSAGEDIRESKSRRLGSWKAIAQYLEREVRSVQRWEQERGLPVHRVPGEKGGGVFAYEDELDAWLASRSESFEQTDVAAASSSEASPRVGQRAAILPVAGIVIVTTIILAVLTLWRWEGAKPPVAPPRAARTIAVLPMINLSGDVSQDYFADGFTEELVTDLAQLRSLRVISRTSTMIYKGSKKPLPEIARELGAKYIVEGSVERAGDRVRVIAQLIDAPSDTHIAAHTYNADVRDVLAVQADISRAIAGDVRLDLSPEEKQRLASAHEIDPVAHDLYLRASYAYAQQTADSIRQSLTLYRAAVEKSSSFAAAYVGVAQAEVALMTITAESPDQGEQRAKEALAKALAIDPHLGEAHGLLAVLVYWRDRNWPEAEREYRSALAEGAQSQTQRHFGLDLVTRGRFGEGMAHLQTALELDPLGMSPRMSEFFGYYFERRYTDARSVLEEVLTLHPDFLAGRVLRGLAAFMQHNCAQTASDAEWAQQEFPSPLADFESALASDCRGDRSTARQSLAKMTTYKGSRYIAQYQLALGYAAIGDKDAALSYVEKSVDAHEGQATYLKVEPLFDSIRTDPRFIAQEKRVGLVQ